MAPIVLLSFLLHAWVGWRIATPLAVWGPLPQWSMWGVLTASALLMPMPFLTRSWRALPFVTAALNWGGLLGMGFFSTLFVLTVLRDGALLLALAAVYLLHRAHGILLPVDGLQVWSAAAVPVLALLATLWGLWNARQTAQVTRVDVPIAGLPRALHGFCVVQISDIHVGPTIRHDYLQRIVERVNTLNADIVAITGDLVDGSVDALRRHVAPLSQLVSTHGSFFVTGNHEYYAGADAWMSELRGLGVQVLLNEHKVVHHPLAVTPSPAERTRPNDSAMVVVAGVADFGAHRFDASHRSDPRGALQGAPLGAGLRLLLAHQPRSALAAAGVGYDLQLSGHTHGGQFWPWMHFVRFQQPFTAGLRKLGDLWVYTNRGTGYWGPPKRLGVAAEITCLRLVTA